MTSLSVNTGYGTTNYTSLADCAEYQVQSRRQQSAKAMYGDDIDFKSFTYLSSGGDNVLQMIENWVEAGDVNGDGIDANTLSWDRYITSSNNNDNVVFQSANGGTYTNMRFDLGYYSQMGEKQFAYNTGAFGSDLTTKPYDTVIFGQDQAQFVDYKFSGLNDGQDFNTINFDAFSGLNWSKNVSYVSKEFNANEVTFGEAESVEGWKANSTLSEIQSTESQWMTSSMKSLLSNYREGTTSYNNAYMYCVRSALDQEAGYSTSWLS